MAGNLPITTVHETPHSAAREILGKDHPMENALVAMLRKVYTRGFEDGLVADPEAESAILNPEWEYLGDGL